MTLRGFSPVARQLIKERACPADDVGGVGFCEKCGLFMTNIQIHHRRPRGMGSSQRPQTNEASNGLCLCVGCHAHVEASRAEALKMGWLVPQHRNPSEIPVLLWDGWFMLTDDGDRICIPEPATGSVA